MERRRAVTGTLIEKVTTELQYEKPKGFVVGFIPVCGFVENGEIIANLAYLIANRGFTVCAVDFKVFYPNLFDWLGGVSSDKKAEGLIRLLHSDRTAIQDAVLRTNNEQVFLVSPSPNDDIEDYFNFSIEDVKRVITMFKEAFDVVLIDIPNDPSLEFCLGALMHCQRGFFVASERIESLRNIQKLSEFMLKITDNIRAFNSVILARTQEFNYDITALTATDIVEGEKTKLKLAAKIPFIKGAQEFALEGRVYMRDGSFTNKTFARELGKLADIVLEVNG